MASLNGTLPDLQAAYTALAAFAASQGITIGVADYGGIRTQADTTKILAYRDADFQAAVNAGQIAADTSLQAFRPIAAFGTSYHNYGAAFDVSIVSRPSNISEAKAQQILGTYAPSIGLRWGGLFRNPDPPHLELAIPLSQAQAAYVNTGGTASGGGTLDNLLKMLPSLTPTLTPGGDMGTADIYGPVDVSAVADAGFPADVGDVAEDDSGSDGVIAVMPPQGADMQLFVLGGVVVVVLAWAIKRRLS